MKHYFEDFKYCPKCGQEYYKDDFNCEGPFFSCKKCQFRFFQNSKPAAAAIIPRVKHKDEILLTERAIEPGKGLMDIPGGFLNYAEKPSYGAIREVREELGIDIEIEKLLVSNNEDYLYQEAYQNVLALYFLAKPIEFAPKDIDKKENYNCKFYKLSEIINNPERMAFKCDYDALKNYLESLN